MDLEALPKYSRLISYGGVKTIVVALLTYIALSAATTVSFNRCCAAPELLVEDRQSLWRLHPGFRGIPTFFGLAENIAPVQIDERGFRALQPHGPGLDGSRRTILAVGDSFTFGWDVAENETYPSQLQSLLDQLRPGVFEVINGGMPGCSSFQAKQLLRRWIPLWRPTIIVLLLGRNDGRQSLLSDESAQTVLRWKIPGSNYVYPFMFLHYRSLQSLAGWVKARSEPRVSVERFYANVNEIIDQAKAHGVAVVLMQHWSGNSAYDLLRLASERAVPYIPLPPLLEREAAARRSSLFIKRHFHPNPEGYRVIAEELADLIPQLSQTDP